MPIAWNVELVDQLDWHWSNVVRPRLDSLSDEEYRWFHHGAEMMLLRGLFERAYAVPLTKEAP